MNHIREKGAVRFAEDALVEINVHCEKWHGPVPDAECVVENAARAVLAGVGRQLPAPVTLGVVLTDDAEQRRLNRDYRGKDSPTNVLSFALADAGMPPPAGAPLLLGDVVLAYETIAREAQEQKKPLAAHLQHLVVHGVLHLLGYDHENDTEAAIMEKCEVAILSGLGVPDPYRDTI